MIELPVQTYPLTICYQLLGRKDTNNILLGKWLLAAAHLVLLMVLNVRLCRVV